MKRRRGRPKSIPDYAEDSTDHATATSPETGMRRPKRNSSKPPAKTSRLQPSEPLHMTTRRAASRAATNSTAPSIASGDSRRSSLTDATYLVGGVDIDADRPTKKARRSSTTVGGRSIVRQRQSPSQEPVYSSTKSISRKTITPEPPRIEEPQDEPQIDKPVTNGAHEDARHDARQLLSPMPKRRGRRPKAAQATTPSAFGIDSPAPGTPSNLETQENGTDRDASKVGKRMPGRRRAPNPDASIEADLRRQLNLRLGYRAVAKALKPVLAELSRRTIDALEDEEEAYKESDEYISVQDELDRLLAQRLEVLENERRIKSTFREEHFQSEKENIQQQCINVIRALQDDYAERAESRLLELYRKYENELDEDGTDDEDGVVPPRYGKTSDENPTGRLDQKYDSRSRFFLETERLGFSRGRRVDMRKQKNEELREDGSDSGPPLPKDDERPAAFGTIDISRREHALAALNVNTLARALDEVETQMKKEQHSLEILPNDAALGLQALADASLQSSIVGPMAAETTPEVLVKQSPVMESPMLNHRASVDAIMSPTRPAAMQDMTFQAVAAVNESPGKKFGRDHSRKSSNSTLVPPSTPKSRREEPVLFSPTTMQNGHLSTPNDAPNPRVEDAEPELERTAAHRREISGVSVASSADHQMQDAGYPPNSRPSRSRWLSLLDQSLSRSKEPENVVRHPPLQEHPANARPQDAPGPYDNQFTDRAPANLSSHQRNMSIPSRLATPPSFARRSQSPIASESGRRATVGQPSNLVTNFSAAHPPGSPGAGSQSAVEPLQRRRSEHPPPGSWQGGPYQHQRHSSSHAAPQSAHPGRYPNIAPSPSPYPGQPPYPGAQSFPPPPPNSGPYQGPPQYAPHPQYPPHPQYGPQPPPGPYPPLPPPQYTGQPYPPSGPQMGSHPPPGYPPAGSPYGPPLPPPYPHASYAPLQAPYSTAPAPNAPQATYGPPPRDSREYPGPPPPPPQPPQPPSGYQPGHVRQGSGNSWSR